MKKHFVIFMAFLLLCQSIVLPSSLAASNSLVKKPLSSKSAVSSVFNDITKEKYKSSIEYLKTNNIIKGYDDGSFKPVNKINRAEFIKIVLEGAKIEIDSTKYKNCFPDVKEEWFAKYICYGKEKNIIKGYPDGKFYPANEINYVEALKIMYEASKDLGKSNPQGNEWYAKYLEDAQENNVSLTELESKLSQSITRGQMAGLMHKFLNKTPAAIAQELKKITNKNFKDRQAEIKEKSIDIAIETPINKETTKIYSTTTNDVTGINEQSTIVEDEVNLLTIYDEKSEQISYFNLYPNIGTKDKSVVVDANSTALTIISFLFPLPTNSSQERYVLNEVIKSCNTLEPLATDIEKAVKKKEYFELKDIENSVNSVFNNTYSCLEKTVQEVSYDYKLVAQAGVPDISIEAENLDPIFTVEDNDNNIQINSRLPGYAFLKHINNDTNFLIERAHTQIVPDINIFEPKESLANMWESIQKGISTVAELDNLNLITPVANEFENLHLDKGDNFFNIDFTDEGIVFVNTFLSGIDLISAVINFKKPDETDCNKILTKEILKNKIKNVKNIYLKGNFPDYIEKNLGKIKNEIKDSLDNEALNYFKENKEFRKSDIQKIRILIRDKLKERLEDNFAEIVDNSTEEENVIDFIYETVQSIIIGSTKDGLKDGLKDILSEKLFDYGKCFIGSYFAEPEILKKVFKVLSDVTKYVKLGEKAHDTGLLFYKTFTYNENNYSFIVENKIDDKIDCNKPENFTEDLICESIKEVKKIEEEFEGINNNVLSVGGNNSCALLNNGTVKCWGVNYSGQLGDGTKKDSNIPVAVKDLSEVASLRLGDDHTCALLKDGAVKCWGNNVYGQLGDGTKKDSNIPVTVKDLSGVASLSIGGYSSCALLNDGTVKCWGMNGSGQLGDGTNKDSNIPVTVKDLSGVASLSIGEYSSCALLKDGNVKCWGGNYSGELGDGVTSTDLYGYGYSNIPVTVKDLSGVISLSLGYNPPEPLMFTGCYACALLKDGTVKCWGANDYGQLGDGTNKNSNIPVTVKDLSGVTSLSLGAYKSCALLKDGTLKCWGSDLGDGTNKNSNIPVTVKDLSGVASLSLGGFHSCALLNNGNVKCWGGGKNWTGELGDGTNKDSNIPVTVKDLSGVTSLSLGYHHTCALLNNGNVKCWGNNSSGGLGDGVTSTGRDGYSNIPVTVKDLNINGDEEIGEEAKEETPTAQNKTDVNCGQNIVYQGEEYPTVKIGEQCWLAKNLNVGTMLASPATMPTNNATIEKWCNGSDDYGHTTSGDCATYGGLYSWDEMMGYNTKEGAQGICPSGWHIPTDAEWNTLESGLATETCTSTRTSFGCDYAGTKLSTKTLNGTNISGFTALLAGNRGNKGLLYNRGTNALLWSSSSESGDTAWLRYLRSSNSAVHRSTDDKASGFSVRCVQD